MSESPRAEVATPDGDGRQRPATCPNCGATLRMLAHMLCTLLVSMILGTIVVLGWVICLFASGRMWEIIENDAAFAMIAL